jgi:fumarylacetoacetate (FAA) hydrolase family protein
LFHHRGGILPQLDRLIFLIYHDLELQFQVVDKIGIFVLVFYAKSTPVRQNPVQFSAQVSIFAQSSPDGVVVSLKTFFQSRLDRSDKSITWTVSNSPVTSLRAAS